MSRLGAGLSIGTMVLLLGGCIQGPSCLKAGFEVSPSGHVLPLQIAHAGGAVDGHDYTNACEALDFWHDRGCRWFEIDLNWTSDGRLVAIHDWNKAAERIFGPDFNGCWMSHDAFMEQPRLDGLTSVDDRGLGQWLLAHPEAVVVTDCKWANVDALALLTVMFPEAMEQVVPQIYSFEEYDAVRALGFENLILTLYQMDETDEAVLDFVVGHDLVAVAMPFKRTFGGLPGRLADLGMPSLVHTVNRAGVFERLRKGGVHGIYTDVLCGCPEEGEDE